MDEDEYSFMSTSDSDVSDDSMSSVTGENEVKKIKSLAVTETRNIRLWRFLILALILVTGAAVTAVTFSFLSKEYDNDGKESYKLFCNSIDAASRSHVTTLFEANRGLSHEITANALSTNQSFPFFTFEMFEVHAESAHQRASMEFVAVALLVEEEERTQWEEYATKNQDWLLTSRKISTELHQRPQEDSDNQIGSISPFIQKLYGTTFDRDPGPGPYAVTWQMSPTPASLDWINLNGYSSGDFPSASVASSIMKDFAFGSAKMHNAANAWSKVLTFEQHCNNHNNHCLDDAESEANSEKFSSQPHVSTIQPLFGGLNPMNSRIVGWLWGVVAYDSFLRNLLPDGVRGIDVVLSNRCNESFTYQLNGSEVVFVGNGDQHDQRFDNFERIVTFTDNYENPELIAETEGHCIFELHVYPTELFFADYDSGLPLIVSVCVASTFLVMAIAFVVFDAFVQRRNIKVVGAAARSQAIVSSLFPSNVRDRLLIENESSVGNTNLVTNGTKSTLRNFLTGTPIDECDLGEDGMILKSKPIADLFPETTILFADIAGFTAWSSVREPAQVFMLLETVYRAFDEIARKRRVYKVETIGDCYVAVCGLPDPRKDHAVVMARFARDCMHRMNLLAKRLEVLLGPDTGDLSMRMGLHSGPVTAGVLRGERSRFQLFGDSMNTAARMEHTGLKGRIQLSQETADLLIAAGKFSWLTPREDKVFAKGKGEMQTQWLELRTDERSESCSVAGLDIIQRDDIDETDTRNEEIQKSKRAEKKGRLIDWNVDVLHRLLKQIVARRIAAGRQGTILSKHDPPVWTTDASAHHTVLEEVKEIITLPEFNAKAATQCEDTDEIELSDDVVYQLKHYVSNVAAMYRNNPFHNFEHASHVTMSVVKLLSRIVAPSDLDYEEHVPHKKGKSTVASTLHDHTYGITSDPLTQFACVFSALIHDIDHSGVPNEQLVKEQSKIAAFYKGKSVAEQNSVDLAWDLLMDERYTDLRATIYCDVTEFKRFRQLVVNAVMATDIVDKELKGLRNARWEKAFSDSFQDQNPEDARNRKATIVIEHLIQASDVAHTMQHWHIYRKWNERLFMECFKAYTYGRADKNPVDNWYEGELAFFDYYIIPLAKKLKECGVFGVSSHEYLNYAVRNRREWEDRGREVVKDMVQKLCPVKIVSTTDPLHQSSSTVSSTSSSDSTPKHDSDDESDVADLERNVDEEDMIQLKDKVDAWNEKAKRSKVNQENSKRTKREGVFFM